MPVSGGEEQQVTDALHKGYWGHFAVTDAGIYLLNSEAAPKPTIMFYNFQTRLLTPVLQLEAARLHGSKSRRFARRTDIVVYPAGSPA